LPTFYVWTKRYGGVGVAGLQRLKELEREDARLNCILEAQASEFAAKKDVLTLKLLRSLRGELL
jgi:hypothetical protein